MPIETVQDIVQEELVLAGHMRVAERYIVYRAERALLRARDGAAPPAAPDGGRRRPARRIAFASIGLDLDLDAGRSSSASCARSIRPGGADLRGSSCSTPRR